MLADAAPYLCCPLCRRDLELAGSALACGRGHRFDVARQGYASLLAGDARQGTADTAAMVAARARFLGSGAYATLSSGVAAAVREVRAPGCVVDAGGGTGHHLAAALEASPDRVGISCDLSRYAARRAAKAHPRIGAVVADVWRGVPVRDGSAAAVVNVFAPRNSAEFHRVLQPDGRLVVVTPQEDHLVEVVDRLGLLSVDEAKPRRLREALAGHFAQEHCQALRWSMRLSRDDVRDLAQMGPSAWHTTSTEDHTAEGGIEEDREDSDGEDLTRRLATLGEPVDVTAAVTVATYRPKKSDASPT